MDGGWDKIFEPEPLYTCCDGRPVHVWLEDAEGRRRYSPSEEAYYFHDVEQGYG